MTRIDQAYTSGAAGTGEIDLGPNGSVQLMFAKLQLLMANEAKVKAEVCIKKIEGVQEEQQYALRLINKARGLQNDAKNDINADSDIKLLKAIFGSIESFVNFVAKSLLPEDQLKDFEFIMRIVMTPVNIGIELANMLTNPHPYQSQCSEELKKYFAEHGIVLIPKNGNGWVNEKDWEANIKSLDSYQNTLPAMTQTMMVQAQNYLGQYNSFMIGATTAISEAKNTLNSLQKA